MGKRIIMLCIGLVLVASVVLTGTYGLSEANIRVYERAVSLSGDFGFNTFSVSDYPIAFYDGDKDYVVAGNGTDYDVEERKAVMNFVVATAYPVDDGYQVLTPTVEKMSSLTSLMSMGKGEYGEEEHIATLWHEAFHCCQMTRFSGNIERLSPNGVKEEDIVKYADGNAEAVALFKRQAELLEKAVCSDEFDKLREYIVEYKELEAERNKVLPQDILAMENYYICVEGTACYVESQVYKCLMPDAYNEMYLDGISDYNDGTSKYYKMGMALSLVMDKLNPDWEESYDFSESIAEMIYGELEKNEL